MTVSPELVDGLRCEFLFILCRLPYETYKLSVSVKVFYLFIYFHVTQYMKYFGISISQHAPC